MPRFADGSLAMTDTMTIPRLFITQNLSQDASITIDDKQAHYLLNVLRKKQGDAVLLFNGRDGEWRGVVHDVAKKHLVLSLQEQTRAQVAAPDIWLVFAPIKSGRIDFLAEKATELGVSRIMPVRTDRTIVSRVNHRKLSANALEAAEQTERLDVPEVDEEYPTLKQLLGAWNEKRTLIYCDESGAGAAAGALFADKAPPLAVLIGPEGGFTEAEFALLRAQPFAHALSLGPRILRADTAALASLTLLQLYCGDW